LVIGFGILISFLTVLGLVGVFSLLDGSDGTTEVIRVYEQSVLCQHGLKDVALARSYMWLVIAEPGEAETQAKKMEAHFTEGTKRLKELADSTRDPARREKAGRLLSLLDEYHTGATALVGLSKGGELDSQKFKDTQAAAVKALVELNAVGDELSTEYSDAALGAGRSGQDDARRGISVMLALGTVAFVLGVFAAWRISTSITAPLASIIASVQALGAGKKDIVVKEVGRADEFGPLGKALEQWRLSLIEEEKRFAAEEEDIRIRQERQERIMALTSGFDRSVSGVLDTVAGASVELEATASSMAAAAEQTNRQATTVASATEQASNAVQTVASAAEQLAASINEIGRQVAEASGIAGVASTEAGRTNGTVMGLSETVSKIGDVVRLIQDIASQTNLLALNATIEAARAGDAGKGFAVVAGEVKNLANQTARATDEIGQQIASVQARTKDVVEAIGGIVQRIEEINGISAAISSAVEEQTAATAEIAGNVQQAAHGTGLVSSSITGVSEAASATGSASQQVLASAKSLSGESDHLRAVVNAFLKDVRAA
jgi:methyl-accepting chemotaxis protein